MATVDAMPAMDEGKTFLGHPRGLFVLFFAEMWERFSYYGMRALLTLYLIQHFLFSDEKAYIIYGAYTALVYITPAIGGYLADRWLGARKAVLYGAILLTFGHFLMGFEGGGGQDPFYLSFFYLALAFIIVGSGFLKANISVIVGQLYRRDDPRRDPAYTIFYMGINLGSALGALIAGGLGQIYGWSYGFGAAGFGMLLGTIVFVVFKPALRGRGEPSDPALLTQKVIGISREWLIYAGGLVGVVAIWLLIQNQDLVGYLLAVFGAVLVVGLLFYSTFYLRKGGYSRDGAMARSLFLGFGGLLIVIAVLTAIGGLGFAGLAAAISAPLAIGGFTLPLYGLFSLIGAIGLLAIMVQQVFAYAGEDRDRIYAAMFLIVCSILFWALFEQAGSSLNVFTDRQVDRHLFGFEVPASMFQSINSIYIIIFAPVLAWLWTTLSRKNLEPSAPAKFGLGLIQLGAGFLVLAAGALAAGTAPTPVIFIFLIYLLHTTGELCLSPVGLSAMTKMSLPRMTGLLMGTWFFATAAGNFVAGLIAQATGGGENVGPDRVIEVYSKVGWTGVVVGVVVLVIAPIVSRKLMHIDTLGEGSPDRALAGEDEIGEPQAAGTHTDRELR